MNTDKGHLTGISSQSKKAKLLHPITVAANAAPGTLMLGCSSGDVCLMQCPTAPSASFSILGEPLVALRPLLASEEW